MITLEEAQIQYSALSAASEASPILQLRKEFRMRSREWGFVIKDHNEIPDEDIPMIELVGSLGPGITVISRGLEGDVIRVLVRDGQTSLHVQDQNNGRQDYINFFGPSSPVIVKGI